MMILIMILIMMMLMMAVSDDDEPTCQQCIGAPSSLAGDCGSSCGGGRGGSAWHAVSKHDSDDLLRGILSISSFVSLWLHFLLSLLLCCHPTCPPLMIEGH